MSVCVFPLSFFFFFFFSSSSVVVFWVFSLLFLWGWELGGLVEVKAVRRQLGGGALSV